MKAADVKTFPYQQAAGDPLCLPGEAEVFKFGWHLGLFGLALTAAGYNAMAFSERRQRHLFVNAFVYVGIAWWESHQMRRHLDALTGQP